MSDERDVRIAMGFEPTKVLSAGVLVKALAVCKEVERVIDPDTYNMLIHSDLDLQMTVEIGQDNKRIGRVFNADGQVWFEPDPSVMERGSS